MEISRHVTEYFTKVAAARGWTMQKETHPYRQEVECRSAKIDVGGGYVISVYRDSRDESKAKIYGTFPKTKRGEDMNPSTGNYSEWGKDACAITVSMSRDPKTVGKDIERRFLPQFKRVYDKQVKYTAAWDARDDANEAFIREAAELMGVAVPDFGKFGSGGRYKVEYYYARSIYGNVTPHMGDDPTIEMELKVTPECAKEIMAAMAKMRREK